MILKEISEQSKSHQQLILKLYKRSTNPKARLTQDYQELQNFKLQVEVEKSGAHHSPYHAMLKKAFTYRSIFIALGALFFFFAALIYEQSINWLPYSFIFSNGLMAKNTVITLCYLLSFAAFGMSFTITAEKEAMSSYIRRTKRKLSRIYNKHNFRVKTSADSAQTGKNKLLKQLRLDALDKVDERREVTRILLGQIAKADVKDQQQKAKLYNEALLELNDHLHLVINQFKKNSLEL
jgi:hypothetical protein